MHSILRRYYIVLLFALLFFGIIPVNAETVKIGVILPLSGAIAASGEAFREAARMAVEDAVNTTKLQYQLIFEDDRFESKSAGTAATKLINVDKVDALLSTWSYGGSVVSPIAMRAGVMHISVAWARSIAAGKGNFLHLAPPKAFLPNIFAVMERRGMKRIAGFAAAEAGSIYALEELERLAPTYKVEVVSREEFPASETDFRQVLARELRKQPDLLYVNLFGSQFELFIKQMKDIGIKVPVIVQTGLSTVESLVPYEGWWYVSDAYFPDQELEKRLVSRTGHHQTLYAANFYDSVRAIIYAFEQRAKMHGRKPSRDQLLSESDPFSGFSSIFPECSIDSDGVFNYASRYYRIRNGAAEVSSLDDIVASNWGR